MPSPPADSPAPIPATRLYSCADIAQELGRHTTSVWRVIRRLGLEPAMITASQRRYYSPDAIPVVRDHLRAPNAAGAE